MPRIRLRRLPPVALALVAVVTVAACGSGSGSARATARPGAQVAVGSAGAGGAPRTQALAYARCMRAHGVRLADPTFDRSGRPQWGPAAGSLGTDGEHGRFEVAREACEHTWPAMEGRYQRSPEELTRLRTVLLAFAACMRAHGVAFPDPTFDQDGRPEFGHDAAAAGGHDATFTTAARTCGDARGDRPVMGTPGR